MMRRSWLVLVVLIIGVLFVSAALLSQAYLRAGIGGGQRAESANEPVQARLSEAELLASSFAGPETATLKWRYRAGGAGYSFTTVAIAPDNTLYSSSGNRVVALDPTGAERWSCDLGGRLGPVVLSPEGLLFVMEADRTLCAVSLEGELRWRYEFPDTVYTDPVAGKEGMAFVGCSNEILYAIDKQGQLAWQFVGGELIGTPPRLGSDGLLYIVGAKGYLLALTQDGEVERKSKLPEEAMGELAGDPRTGFVLSSLAGVLGIASDGSKRWEFVAKDWRTGQSRNLTVFCEYLVRKDGGVMFGDADGWVYALNSRGRERWRYKSRDQVWGKPLVLPQNRLGIRDHSGTFSVLDADGSLAWEKHIGDNNSAHATASAGADGAIYVSGGGVLYALRQDGSTLWEYASSGGGGFASTPVLGSDGTIYATCLDSQLYALNPDGTLRWTAPLERCDMFAPALAGDGTLLVPGGSKLYALHPDGSAAWEYQASADLGSNPVLAAAGTIFLGATNGLVLALKPSGSLDWSYPTTGQIYGCSPALAADGTVYIGTGMALSPRYLDDEDPEYYSAQLDGTLYALKPGGKLAWKFTTGAAIWSTPTVAADGKIYCASTQAISMSGNYGEDGPPAPPGGELFALTSTGSKLWSQPLLPLNQGSVAIGRDGTLYINSWDRYPVMEDAPSGLLYAFSPEGALLWQGPYGCICTPCIGADGTIYSAGVDKKLYALTADGKVRWSFQMGELVPGSPVIGPDGTLYVGSSDGYLYAFQDR